MEGKLQASIKDVVTLLGTYLFSEPTVVIRELIQNSYDSIINRYGSEASKLGKIEFRIISGSSIEVSDNGIGMNEDDLVIYLSTMGKTLKKMSENSKLIGKFGIGFFSSFKIADTVVVTTKKADGKLCSWTSDGVENYFISSKDERTAAIGTTVTLHLQRASNVFAQDTYLKQCIKRHCNFLNCSIFCNGEQVNSMLFPWEIKDKDKMRSSLQNHYGHEIRLFKHFRNNEQKFDCILSLADSGIDFELYSKRLFVNNNLTNVVIEELKFIKTIINCDNIELTLSREEHQKNSGWTLIANSVRKLAIEWIQELAFKHLDDPLIIEIVKENQPRFQKAALKDNALFNQIYNLIAFDLSNFDEEQITITQYLKIFKVFDRKVYYNEKKSTEKLYSLLRVLRERKIPVFEVENYSQNELLRKIANKISAQLVDIEAAGDSLLEDFKETRSNKLLGICETVTHKNVKYKAIDPDWQPMIMTADSVYLNSKNPFINDLDNLRLNSANSRIIYQNFFKVFESITQIKHSADHVSSILIKNVIHSFKNWISSLEKSEQFEKGNDFMQHWWSDQVSIRDLAAAKQFMVNGETYNYRCFIVCPFAPKYTDVINQVRNTFSTKGVFAETAENIDNIAIFKKVCAAIDHCDFAVVDISENNPNVMLELGLLIARRKPAIIIRNTNVEMDQGIKVPVDIISIERLEYSNTSEDLHRKLSTIGDIITQKTNAKKPF